MNARPLVLLPLLFLAGCDLFFGEREPPDPDPPAQTELLGVRVVPNPVAPGDTTTITAVIRDSLDTRFRFFWSTTGGVFQSNLQRGLETKARTVRWIAHETIGEYRTSVTIDNGSRDSVGVGISFDIIVAQQ